MRAIGVCPTSSVTLFRSSASSLRNPLVAANALRPQKTTALAPALVRASPRTCRFPVFGKYPVRTLTRDPRYPFSDAST